MERIPGIAWALLRIVAGLLYASHGAQKLFGWFGSPPVTGKPLLLAAAVIEIVCGILVAIGLFARPAAFVASGEMAVAYFMVHAPQAFWPVQNKGENAVLYCFYFLLVAAQGAGVWSLDAIRRPPARFAPLQPRPQGT
ncbi:MAG TPA: DoxX family protein [Thermoanaerobaculia bacterium]|nr:DoxX family protein [Thermoanaerobaculia bacterium]